MLNGLDLFSGIAGLTIALSDWVRPVAYCEADRYCQGVLLTRMGSADIPHAPIWDDVRTLRGDMLPPVDIIYGGFPCQDISCAGTGGGLEGERSSLVFEMLRLVDEIRPQFVFMENVPAIRFRGSSVIVGRLAILGYNCRWDVLGAADMGAPHQRDRWWLLAHANGQGLVRRRTGGGEAEICKEQVFADTPVSLSDPFWRAHAADLARIHDGLSPKSHRTKSVGNAVVPQCAREAFMRLAGLK